MQVQTWYLSGAISARLVGVEKAVLLCSFILWALHTTKSEQMFQTFELQSLTESIRE